MKPPPTDPEFARFADAMRQMMKVSKTEMDRRIKAAKRKPKTSASRASGEASTSHA